MNWSIIYSYDLLPNTSPEPYIPISDRWIKTEDDDEYDFDYLGDDYVDGKHGKFVAYLTNKEFVDFLNTTLYPDSVESTMGMIGAQLEGGMTPSMLPAWSLSSSYDHYAISLNAYVCPMPDGDEEITFLQSKDDQQIREWIEKEYT